MPGLGSWPRDTIVEVTDGDGEKRSVVRMPYRFSDAVSGPVRGVPEPGEHTGAILRDWTSHPDLRTAHPDYPPGAMRRQTGLKSHWHHHHRDHRCRPAANAMKPRIQCAWAQRVVATVPVDDPFRVHHMRAGASAGCRARVGQALGPGP